MLEKLEKTWPAISVLFTLAILASLLFLPRAARPLGLAVMVLGPGLAVFFTVRRHAQAHRRGEITRPALARRAALDVTGLLLTLAAVIPAGAAAGSVAGRAAWAAAEVRWPGWGVAVGVLTGLLAGAAAGGGAGLLARWTWGRLAGKPTGGGRAAASGLDSGGPPNH